MKRVHTGIFLVLDVDIARLVQDLHATQVHRFASVVTRRLEVSTFYFDVSEAFLSRKA